MSTCTGNKVNTAMSRVSGIPMYCLTLTLLPYFLSCMLSLVGVGVARPWRCIYHDLCYCCTAAVTAVYCNHTYSAVWSATPGDRRVSQATTNHR